MNRIGIAALGIGMAAAWPAIAQQSFYGGQNVTGKLVLTRVINPLQLAQQLQTQRAAAFLPETKPRIPPKRLRPPQWASLSAGMTSALSMPATQSQPAMQSLPVVPPANPLGFSALTHLDQRLANGGNQFSVEPPNPSIAVANGYIVEGVNNAFQVYNTSGLPLLRRVLATNELFGVPAAIDRSTGDNGVYPTDMRVFYDHTIARWFILQRAQDYDRFGNPLISSHLYMAVSQTVNPTGNYNIYVMDTTNTQNPGCPCVADYPQIGADQYGFYISVNEFDAVTEVFQDAAIMAISKAALGAGASTPTMYRFLIPFVPGGFEFAIQPASTPPGGSYFLANGGMEYFVSSQTSSISSSLAIWAMYNTATLGTATPSPVLTRIVVPTLTYTNPGRATQRPGPRPYGSTLFPPVPLATLDGGDTRIQALSYAGGRLFVTLATGAVDETGRSVVGGAYVIFSPTFRAAALAASVLRQGYILTRNNHLLRTAIAVNAQGRGAMAFTLVGPDYFPSAAFVRIDTLSTGSTIQIAGPGALPEDGFSSDPDGVTPGVARWGDYSTAVAGGDGKIWMVTEYIPSAPRTEFANWGTFLWGYIP